MAIQSAETIAGSFIPETALVGEASEFIRSAEGDVLFHHSRRVFLFGALHGRCLELQPDLELLYAGAMFHDVGLTARYVYGSVADKVWLSIALHTTPEVPARLDPESALLAAGVKTDVVGVGRKTLSPDAIDAVTTPHPRPDFKNRVLVVFNDGMKHRPDSTFGTMNADVLRHFDRDLKPRNMVEAIRNSPWPQ